MVGGGKRYGFEQGAKCDVADMSVEVINTMSTGIAAVYDEVIFINDFKPPWLGVVRAGRPTCYFQNLLYRMGFFLIVTFHGAFFSHLWRGVFR